MRQELKNVLQEALQPITQILEQSREPTQTEKDNVTIAQSSYKIARASIVISVVFGLIGIILIVFQIKSSVEIKNFNTLLTRDSELISKNSELIVITRSQLDTEIQVNRKLGIQLEVLMGQYNMSVEGTNIDNQKMLREKLDSYNELAEAFNELENTLFLFRDTREKHALIMVEDVKARLNILTEISSRFKVFKNVGILIPFRGLAPMADSCVNSIGRYKFLCSYNITRGVQGLDTSYLGNKMFSDVIYYFMDFEDSAGKYLEEGRNRIQRNLNQVENAINVNSVGSKRNPKHH